MTGVRPASPKLPAPDPKRLVAAKELIGIMQAQNVYKNTLEAMNNHMLLILSKENPGKEDKLRKVIWDSTSKILESHTKEIADNNAIVYANTYTEQELQEMTKFYKTPTGQKVVETMPQLMSQALAANQMVIAQTLQESMTAIREQVQKQGLNMPKGTSPPSSGKAPVK